MMDGSLRFIGYLWLSLCRNAPVTRGGNRGQRLAVLQLLHHFLDGAVQLLVLTVPFLNRVVIYHDIGVYAMVLDNPITCLRVVAREERHTDIRPVQIGERSADADDSTPGTYTDQLTQAQGTEAPWEEVAIGGGIFVDKANLRAHLYGIGHGSYQF